MKTTIFRLASLATLIAAVFATAIAPSAFAAAPPVSTANGVLVGSNGMTLYAFDNDTAGKSACNGPCTANWPPLAATPDDMPSGDYSIVMRDDGSRQWAYKGKALYFWSKDQKPGDMTGEGFRNLWHAAKP